MKTVFNFLLSLTATIACIGPLSACAYTGGPLDGYVLEERTNAPIPGAIVVVRWQGIAFSFVDTRTVCMHVETAIADGQGRYHIPFWRKSAEPVGVRKLEPILIVHKAGYQRSNELSKNEKVEYLKLFKGERGKRLDYLEKLIRASGCVAAGRSQRSLYPLFNAVFEEARNLIETEEDKETLQWIRRQAAYAATAEDRSMTQREADQLAEKYLRDRLQ